MYQPSSACVAQVLRVLSCMRTCMPGGANGVLLKSNEPWMAAWADKDGFFLDEQRRFSVNTA